MDVQLVYVYIRWTARGFATHESNNKINTFVAIFAFLFNSVLMYFILTPLTLQWCILTSPVRVQVALTTCYYSPCMN